MLAFDRPSSLIDQAGSGSLVGNVSEVFVKLQLEQFTREMARGADAGLDIVLLWQFYGVGTASRERAPGSSDEGVPVHHLIGSEHSHVRLSK